MKVNQNIYLTIIIFFLQFFTQNCVFSKAPYITDFTSVELYEEAMKKNEFEHGFMLIYSKYCFHCRHFLPNYIKLSELFHKELFFYALGQNTNYRKLFKIDGFPTILFYSKEKYKEITFGRSVRTISNFIRKHIPYNCTEITYSNIDTVYNDVYQRNDRNIIIGYFKNNSEFLNTFSSITNNLKNDYIDLCYYCTDYDLIKNDKDDKYKKLTLYSDISDNVVKSYSRNKGNNSFLFNGDNSNEYVNFLFENVINLYEDINDYKDDIILEKMENKEFIIFGYNNNETKQKFIKEINTLYSITKYKNESLYYYLLYNTESKIKNFKIIQNDKIYLASKDISNITSIDDLNQIKDKIKENNLKTEEITTTQTNIITNDILKIEIVTTKQSSNSIITDNIINILDTSNNNDKNELINDINSNNIKLNNDNDNDMADVVEEKDNINIKNNDSDIDNININSNDIINSNKNKSNISFIESQIINIKNNIIEKNNISKGANQLIKIKKDKRKNNNFNKNNNSNRIKNKINNKEYNKIEKKIKNEENEEDEESNKIKYILIALVVFFLIMYYIFKKILCVGFIKVYDSQIIEFNQPNKIEIV